MTSLALCMHAACGSASTDSPDPRSMSDGSIGGDAWTDPLQDGARGGQDASDSFSPEVWQRQCSGSGKVNMTHLPMDLADVDFIVPAGALAGPHVTPIDHIYLYPKDMTHRDTSKVYAMADGYLFYYEGRTENGNANHSLFFQYNCSTYSYYDLMTSLAPDLQQQLASTPPPIHIAVRAGQLLGYVGGRSLDAAIFNLDKPLKGFVNEASYTTDRGWTAKQHLDDFFEYYAEPDRSQMLALNLRKSPPFGGRIDWDIDGKLVGNWFLKDSGGYAGLNYAPGSIDNNGKGYWTGHLAIAPDNVTDGVLNISIGSYLGGAAKQFSARDPHADPATVGVSDGITKFELVAYAQPSKLTGPPLDSRTLVGTAMVQLVDGRTLKFEVFPDKKATEVSAFTSAAQTFVR